MPNTALIRLLLLCGVGYIAVMPVFSTVVTYIFRIPGLICIILLSLQNYQRAYPKYRLPLLVIFILCILNITMMNDQFTFDIVLSVFSVFCQLFLIIICSTIQVDNSLRKSIYRISLLGAAVLTIHSIAPYSNFTGTFTSIYLTYGFSNSNFAGITTFLIYSALFMTSDFNRIMAKILTFAVCSWLLYLIFLTNCRSALVAALLVPIAMMVLSKYRLPNILLFIACFVPFIFVPFYLNFTDNVTENVEVMGKGVVSGREVVFRMYLNRIEEEYQYLIGTFDHIPFHNAHNGPLSYFISIGAIGTLCVFGVWIDKLRRCNTLAKNSNAKCAVFVILAVFIESCGEASLFLGGFPSIVYLFIFYVMAASKNIRL